MSTVSKYVKAHPDVLLEWVYDSTNYVSTDYTVIADGLNGRRSLALQYGDTTADADKNANRDDRQLFQLDAATGKWAVADPAVRPYIQHEDHVLPAPAVYNLLRVYFPVNYTFEGVAGFYVGVSAYDYNNAQLFGLSNYYLDASIPAHLAEVKLLTPPWQFQERLWGKCVELLIPSVYDESRNRMATPTPGTINYNLTGGLAAEGLSTTSPIYIDFRFIQQRAMLLGNRVYTLPSAQLASVPQTPEYQGLGVAISKADDGDYYELHGTFNSTLGEFEMFMDALLDTGHRNHILFTVTVYEEGLAHDPITFQMADNFARKIPFCPVLKYTNTTASIQVTMSVVDEVDGSSDVRLAEVGLLPNDVAKFGKTRLSISLSKAVKPKVYVPRADTYVLGGPTAATARRPQVQKQVVIKERPYAKLSSDYSIVASDINATKQNQVFYGKGKLTIELHPFDNVLKFHLANAVDDASFKPFAVAAQEGALQLSFRTVSKTINVDTYKESPELDTANGVYIYLLSEANTQALRAMVAENNNFYLAVNNTVAYYGKYSLSGMDAPLVFSAGDGPAPEATTGSALASQIAAQVLRPADAATAAMSSAVTSSAPPAPAIPDDPYAAYYGEAPQNGGVGSIYKESTDSTSAVNYALIN
jgi:hypothetical protein